MPSGFADLDDDPGGFQSGESRQVNGGLGVSGSAQHATTARAERKMWPGRPSSSGRVSGSMRADGLGPVLRTDPVVQPLPTRSTLTVKGVSNAALLRLTVSSRSSSSNGLR